MRRAIAGAAVAAGLALAACGGGSSGDDDSASAPTIPPPADGRVTEFEGASLTFDDIERLSTVFTDALVSGDRELFLAQFDAGRPELIAQQAVWFDNIRSVGAEDLSLSFVKATKGRDSSGQAALAAEMGLNLRIPGADPRPVSEWYSYEFTKTDDGALTAVAVGGAPADGSSGDKFSRYYRQAWDDGPMAIVRGSRAIVLGPAADAGWMQANIGRFDAAVTEQTDRFLAAGQLKSGDAAQRSWVFTIASPSVSDVFDYFGGRVTPTEADFAGFAQPLSPTDLETGFVNEYEVVTSRIVLARDALDSGLDATLRHEMTHALQQAWRDDRGAAPTWIVEGLAVHLSRPDGNERSFRTSNGIRSLKAEGGLPGDDIFYDGDDTAVAGHYGAGFIAVSFLADRLGEARLLEAIRMIDERPDALEREFGMTTEQIAKEALAWAS